MQRNNIIRSPTKGFRSVKTRVYYILKYIYVLLMSSLLVCISIFCGLIINQVNLKRDNNKTSQRDILLYMRSLDSH